MKSKVQQKNYQKCGLSNIQDGRVATQIGWYKLASELCSGQSVLDVGAGLGNGLKLLALKTVIAHGLEVDSRLQTDIIFIKDITEIDSKSYDTVVCIDVIEHIEEDLDFIEQLVRVARNQIILSTPNWTASRCRWPYHIREYKPKDLFLILKPYGDVSIFKGTPDGDEYYAVKFLSLYFIFNSLRTFFLTAFASKLINFILPSRHKIHSHIFSVLSIKNKFN